MLGNAPGPLRPRREDLRPQGTKPRDEPKMSDMESKPSEPHEETLRELHDALDLTEAHLKRIAAFDHDGAQVVDLVVQLRQRIITLELPIHGEVKSRVRIEGNTTQDQL